MWVDLLPRQRDCRADAVALGAWERWHRRETVPERALRKQTLRPSSHSELVEFARSANFRVCGTRYCPARAAARRGSSGRMPPAPTQSRCAGPLGHYICAPITTEAAPTVKLHSSPLFSGTCRRTVNDKGTGLEQIQRELNTLQPKLGNSRLREFPHALINAHYTGAFSFSVITQQPRAHGAAIIC